LEASNSSGQTVCTSGRKPHFTVVMYLGFCDLICEFEGLGWRGEAESQSRSRSEGYMF